METQPIEKPKNELAFQSLCFDLWREIWGDESLQINGRSGQHQTGVDIYGHKDGKLAGIECKQRSGPRWLGRYEVNKCIEKAQSFKPPLSLLVIATTGPRDAKLLEVIRETNEQHMEKGLFAVQICFWNDLEESIHSHLPEWGLPKIQEKRITSPSDPDFLEGFRELYENNFGEDADANPFRDLIRWVREYEAEEKERLCNPGIDHQWRGFVIVAKVGFRVVGFLHADGHKPTGYLFVNWIAMDWSCEAVRNGRGMGALLGRAIKLVRQEMVHPKIVIAEFMANNKLAALIRWNDGQSDRWGSKLAGKQTQAYVIPGKYIQPHLRIPNPSL